MTGTAGPAGFPGLLYSEEERALSGSLRALLESRCGWARVAARTESADPYDGELWNAVAGAIGCAGLLVPGSLGGTGASYREACAAAEVLGSFVAPVPFLGSAVVATAALLACACQPAGIAGSAERAAGAPASLAADLLTRMGSGSLTTALAVGFTARPGPFPSSVRLGQLHPGDAEAGVARLHGTVTGVADALPAGVLLVPAGQPAGLYAVDVTAEGLSLSGVISLDMTRQLCDVELTCAPGRLVAAGPAAAGAVTAAIRAGAAVLAAEQLGVAQRCLDLTVGYVKQRRQFGRLIGSFQAVKHRLAELWALVIQARAVSRYAAACLAAGGPDGAAAVALAKAYCCEVAVHAAEECVQLHGGIGFTWEHPAHLYLKRAKAASIAFGTPDAHRAALAPLADLPSP